MIAAPRGIARCGIARFGALMALTVLPRALYAAEIQCPAQIQVREQADLSGAHQWQSFDSNPRGLHHFYAAFPSAVCGASRHLAAWAGLAT